MQKFLKNLKELDSLLAINLLDFNKSNLDKLEALVDSMIKQAKAFECNEFNDKALECNDLILELSFILKLVDKFYVRIEANNLKLAQEILDVLKSVVKIDLRFYLKQVSKDGV